MIKKRLHALLIGINDYPEGMRSLKGCINDIQNVNHYLKNHFHQYDLQIETLKNSRATRPNIIEGFRNHLSKAGANDVVLFYFSGHGSRVIAPKGFEEYEPDGRHETLVCYDSRIEGGWDLADKELAVLFSEVAAAQPHILAVLDCCHSASGIRDVDDFYGETTRYTEENPKIRPLESYLEGYFIKNGTKIPKSKMALMAACDKTGKAREDRRHQQGIFTRNLLKVLRESGKSISYADLLLRTRTAVLNETRNQNPQLECIERFNAYSMFLDGKIHPDSHRYRIYNKNGSWRINRGAVHGIPNDLVKEVKIVIYDSPKTSRERSPGSASAGEIEVYGHAVNVDLQESKIEVEPGRLLDINKEYQGDIITLPVPPLNVYLSGDREGAREIRRVFTREYAAMINFVHQPGVTQYEVRCAQGGYRILDRDNNRVISEIIENTEENIHDLLSRLARIERWQRTLRLQNPKTGLNPTEVDFIFYEIKEDGEEVKHPANEITLDYRDNLEEGEGIPFVLKLKKLTNGKLFFTLLHLSPDFGISSLRPCEYIPYTDKEVILDDVHALNIPGETYDKVIDGFLLVVSTTKLDEYLFEQEDIGKEQNFKNLVTRKKIPGDWYTKSITVKTVRGVFGEKQGIRT